MRYAKREPLISTRVLGLDEADRLAERGVVERRAPAAGSPTTRSTSPSSSPPSGTDASAGFGHLEREVAQRGLGVGEHRLRAR